MASCGLLLALVLDVLTVNDEIGDGVAPNQALGDAPKAHTMQMQGSAR